MRARQPRLTPGTYSAGSGSTLGGLDSGDVTDVEDDVLHKVHVMLHTRMDTIRVQVSSLLRQFSSHVRVYSLILSTIAFYPSVIKS